ncbi:MAG: hypothetical protein QG671_4223 [Actinomycetota bacterium]|nr:hypothetical protein [Actinomycetota bacterium]
MVQIFEGHFSRNFRENRLETDCGTETSYIIDLVGAIFRRQRKSSGEKYPVAPAVQNMAIRMVAL